MSTTHSGRFVLRLNPQLHGRLAREASQRRVSLNRLCMDLLRHALETPAETPQRFAELEPLIGQLRKKFPHSLIGAAVFGSRARGDAADQSDLDLLIVLEDDAPVNRGLYRRWDEEIAVPPGPLVNPHFVRLPESAQDAGGLWLEAAQQSIILFEKDKTLSACLERLREFIAADHVRRYWSNGIPYWVRRVA